MNELPLAGALGLFRSRSTRCSSPDGVDCSPLAMQSSTSLFVSCVELYTRNALFTSDAIVAYLSRLFFALHTQLQCIFGAQQRHDALHLSLVDFYVLATDFVDNLNAHK